LAIELSEVGHGFIYISQEVQQFSGLCAGFLGMGIACFLSPPEKSYLYLHQKKGIEKIIIVKIGIVFTVMFTLRLWIML